ncbi:MAG: BlaI/MecI/CopY family transcriptional regulator [Phycisphaerae bacterium]
MSQRDVELGSAELEVLKVLWDQGQSGMAVREVLETLHARGRNVAYTTVQTMLTRLEQKGVVGSDKSGAAFSYRPTVSRDKVIKSRVRQVLDELFDGAAGPLVLQLVRSKSLKQSEIDELQKLIEKLDGE